jgi:two-component SAPR family response regulator
MNCLIVEDEKVAAERLVGLIKKYDQSIDISEIVQSVKNAVQWLNTHQTPDLIFMDIQLADGLSFEIFEQTIVKTPVIFTTAYDEYALKAFKVNSIDYLLKPIDRDELNNAINKFIENNTPKEIPTQVFDSILY